MRLLGHVRSEKSRSKATKGRYFLEGSEIMMHLYGDRRNVPFGSHRYQHPGGGGYANMQNGDDCETAWRIQAAELPQDTRLGNRAVAAAIVPGRHAQRRSGRRRSQTHRRGCQREYRARGEYRPCSYLSVKHIFCCSASKTTTYVCQAQRSGPYDMGFRRGYGGRRLYRRLQGLRMGMREVNLAGTASPQFADGAL